MAESAGFDQDALRSILADEPVESGGECRCGDAAQAAARHLLNDHILIREQCAVDADLAKLIDQHRPCLVRGVLTQQPAYTSRLADAEKAGDQVDPYQTHTPTASGFLFFVFLVLEVVVVLAVQVAGELPRLAVRQAALFREDDFYVEAVFLFIRQALEDFFQT